MPKTKPDPLLAQPARKFLFDHNSFDEDGHLQSPDLNAPPPPPVFSEDELARARTESFAKGKSEGLAEAAASRDKKVADLMQVITHNISTLFAAEDLRIRQYETEAVALARAIFNRLFPALNARHGLEEAERAIREVLEGQRRQPEITLEVHPDFVEQINEYVKKCLRQGNIDSRCRVIGNNTLTPADCRFSWSGGGAGRDTAALAEMIDRQLNQLLADRPRLRDNESEAQPPENNAPEQTPEQGQGGQGVTE